MGKKPATYPAGRYAHPFYSDTPPAQRQPVNGMTRMTDWSKQQLGPVPPTVRGGMMSLADIIGASGAAEVQSSGEIRFHALGDAQSLLSGHKHPTGRSSASIGCS